MRLLQHFLGQLQPEYGDDHITRDLRARADSTDPARLTAAIARAEDARATSPQHFGLAFALGLARERLAAVGPWERRAPILAAAVESYEAALALAEEGQIAGAGLLPEVAADRWEVGLDLPGRARLAAAFQAGLLRAGEFRVRDPGKGAALLRSVVENLKGYHPAWYFLGEAYLLANHFDEAEAAWREGLRRKPGDPALLTVLEKLPIDRVHHRVRGGPDGPDWPGVLRELARLPNGRMPESERLTIEGDAYLALGDPERARACWEAALRADSLAVGVRKRLYQLARVAL
ncbi:MAG TPA: tetratricopeptide repeat protein [Chloroflexota bacterium]|nr:tetratricopeptide repeat protein [Chloroflexota bacterium]